MLLAAMKADPPLLEAGTVIADNDLFRARLPEHSIYNVLSV